MGIIYKITNIVNGMVYVGRSNKTIEEVWTTHRYESNNVHPAKLIGQVIKQFGADNFSCTTIEECTPERLRARQKYWIDFYKSQEKGYNKHHTRGTVVVHDDVVEMHRKGMSAAEIATELGCDERTVINHIKDAFPEKAIKDITKRTGKPSSKDDIMQLWSTGMNHSEIAAQLHLTTKWVKNILRQNGVSLEELYDRSDKEDCNISWFVAPTDSRRRTIYAFSIDDYETQRVFRTQAEAAIALHVHQNIISRHLNDPQRYRSAGGFICTWNENFTYQDWTNAIRYACPLRGRSKQRQTREHLIYLTNIDTYEVTYYTTLLDAVAKAQSSVTLIQQCLRGQALHTKNYFVTDYPLSKDEWEARRDKLHASRKPIYGVHMVTHDVIIASDVQDAAAKVGRSRHRITDALRGRAKSAAGYQWYYGVPPTV